MARIMLLTNDDGMDAPGLAALASAAEEFGQIRVVAPSGEHSGAGHVLTRHRLIPVRRLSEHRLAVEGTPPDCVRLGVHHLIPGVDWVLSGINAGGNLGTDVNHSGTVAAAREAAVLGLPAAAVSHYVARGRALDWPRASGWLRPVLESLFARALEPGTFWNVNLPHPAPDAGTPEVVFCPVDPSPLPVAYRVEPDGRSAHYSGDYQARDRVAGHDVELCFGGRITVSLLRTV